MFIPFGVVTLYHAYIGTEYSGIKKKKIASYF
jgi:hypothetical protein